MISAIIDALTQTLNPRDTGNLQPLGPLPNVLYFFGNI